MEEQTGAAVDPVSAVAQAVGTIVNFFAFLPGRIARQREAARPDALRPGQFQDDSSLMTTILIVLGVFALLFITIIYSSKSK